MKLKIIGRHVTVVEDKETVEDQGAMGFFSGKHNKIHIMPVMTKEIYEDTMVHEMLHAVEDQIRVFNTDSDTEERIVIALSAAILQLLRDNKKFFKSVLS